MKSKTKALKKETYTKGIAMPEQKKTSEIVKNVKNNLHVNRNLKKEAEARSRARRIRSMIRLGMSEKEILEIFKNEDARMVLCLYYDSFIIMDKEKTLRGRHAVEKFLKDNKIEAAVAGPTCCWIKTDKDHVDEIVELLKPVGRTSITKPEPMTAEKIEAKKKAERKAAQKANKKPSNNTAEAKKKAKAARKEKNMKKTAMRSFYAAKRKGGVSKRLKRHNPTLADKIEKWLKEQKAAEAKKAEENREYRAKHRQLTSTEMKANKHARKAAKHIAAQERRREREKKRADYNAKQAKIRAQKAQKPVQTELKMAA